MPVCYHFSPYTGLNVCLSALINVQSHEIPSNVADLFEVRLCALD